MEISRHDGGDAGQRRHHLAPTPTSPRRNRPTSTSGKGPSSPIRWSKPCGYPVPPSPLRIGQRVYGELGAHEFRENHGPLVPVSTYGASKLASEALIASYCHMFELRAAAFRFGNVVGPRQTHGVGFDFLRKLRDDPTRLTILGDGLQSKSYIHVDDVMTAVLLAHESTARFNVFNVATGDYITVCEIADIAAEVLGIDPASVNYEFTGGDRGWKGDVPIVRLNTDRIKALGWKCLRSSAEACGCDGPMSRDYVRRRSIDVPFGVFLDRDGVLNAAVLVV